MARVIFGFVSVLVLAGSCGLQAQPAWNTTGALSTGRFIPLTVLLGDGRVLAVGGSLCTTATQCRSVNSPEIYDPATGAWASTADMLDGRTNHFGVRLPNGKVLVAGGFSASAITNRAELYDPGTGRWTSTGDMIESRSNATCTVLGNGKVLVTGGGTPANSFGARNTAELYDPATGTWASAGAMTSPRNLHTATMLANGKVLLIGGTNGGPISPQSVLATAEIYDPATGAWTAAGSLRTPRAFHTATLLPSGKVLVTGGSNLTSIIYDTAELYDPATGQSSATGNLTAARNSHTATLLPNGKVLAAAGFNNDPANFTQKSAELYDPATGAWSAAASLATARGNHTATLLADGRVLVIGGNGGGSGGLASAEIFDLGAPKVTSVSAASFAAGGALAMESIASAFGVNLAPEFQAATSVPLPTALAGVSVRVLDGAGVSRDAPLFAVSTGQINFQLPPGTMVGPATVSVVRGESTVAVGAVTVSAVAPGLFASNGSGKGLAAATLLRVKADGTRSAEAVTSAPIDLGPDGDQVFLTLYGTGLRFLTALSGAKCTMGGAATEVLYAGATPDAIGLDQVNVRVPRSLAGRGTVDIVLSVDGSFANAVQIAVR